MKYFKSSKIMLISCMVAMMAACSTLELTPQVVIDKLALINSITTLKDSYVDAKQKITVEADVFSDADRIMLRGDVAAIESFYANIKRITDAESAETVAIGLSTFTKEIDTIRVRVNNAATIVANNSSSFSSEAQSSFAVLVGKYNLISAEFDRQLAVGDNRQIASTSIDLINAAIPIVLQIIAATA